MEITLFNYLPHPERTMAACAKRCNTGKPAHQIFSEISDKESRDIVKYTDEHLHHSVQEFSTYVFDIEGVSRLETHQHVRHRVASYLQESLRVVDPGDYKLKNGKYEPWFIVPPSLLSSGCGYEGILEFFKSHDKAREDFQKIPLLREDRRSVLPHGVKTGMSMIANGREYKQSFLKLRMCETARWEIIDVAYAMLPLLKLVSPTLFEDAGPMCVLDKCVEKHKGACKSKTENKIKKIDELIEGIDINTFDSGESVEFDLTDILSKRAPIDLEKKLAKDMGYDNPINLTHEVIARFIKP